MVILMINALGKQTGLQLIDKYHEPGTIDGLINPH